MPLGQILLNVNFRRITHLSSVVNYCSASDGAVVKGVIAKRIPKYVELKKDKTYAWCSCGLSKKQPFCDGSHKNHPKKLQPIRFNPPKDGRFLLCRCKQTNNRPYCDLTHVKTYGRISYLLQECPNYPNCNKGSRQCDKWNITICEQQFLYLKE